MWSYYTWIRNKVEADTPWDAMVRELVTAQGNSLEQGGANFFILHKDPLDMAETTTVAFNAFEFAGREVRAALAGDGAGSKRHSGHQKVEIYGGDKTIGRAGFRVLQGDESAAGTALG